MEMQEFLFDLIKKQGERLFNLVDCGYSEAFAKFTAQDPQNPLSAKDRNLLEYYKDEAAELVRLIKLLGDFKRS